MGSIARRKIWFDTDAGTDDAHAIIMALSHPDVEVVGFSTVRGNSTAAKSAKNVLRVLHLTGSPKVPIYRGTESSLVGCEGDSTDVHGGDGMGDIPDHLYMPDEKAPDYSEIKSENAVSAMMKALRENPGEIELVMLGPLTNLALMLKLEPDIGKTIKHCHIMGGTHSGEGNIGSPCCEFNFYCDPEAAYVVLRELTCPINLTTWETCIKMQQAWEVYNTKLNSGTPRASFIRDINKHGLDHYYKSLRLDEKAPETAYEPADQLVVAALLEPEIITSSVKRRVKVILQGEESRGNMIVDWRYRFYAEGKEINLILDLDKEKFSKMLWECLK